LRADQGARWVNVSLESTQSESYKTDPLDAAVESAWFHGIVVVAAAGNRGTSADAVTRAPGNDANAISVGASTTRAPGSQRWVRFRSASSGRNRANWCRKRT